MKSKPLGKGLQALFGDSNFSEYMESSNRFLEIPAKEISFNPHQPRENIEKTQFDELKNSINNTGLIQPVAVRHVNGKYELVAGERRLRAVIALNIPMIPAYVLEIKNERELLEVSLLENLRRENLNPIEVALGYKKLHEEFGMTQKEIAKSFSVDRSSVTNMMRLTKLPQEIQKKVKTGALSMGHARALVGLPTPGEQIALMKQIIKNELSVRQTEALLTAPLIKKSSSAKSPAKKSPSILQLEERLRYVFGSQVRVKPQKDGGKIEIEYYSSEDLNRLIELFTIIEKNN